MRNRQPGDVIYNVRADGFDPRTALPLEMFDFDLSLERKLMFVGWQGFNKDAGPAAKKIATQILDHVPIEEHSSLKLTVRSQLFEPGDFPESTPATWHTDYAHGFTDAGIRQRCHTWVVVTGPPYTRFIKESAIWLPQHNAFGRFATALQEAELTTFQVEPWSLVKFNATELHTAVASTERLITARLFVRATFDPYRAVAPWFS